MLIKRKARAGHADRNVEYRAEPLEARRLLSTVVWDGGGDGNNWNDPLNWNTDSLPAEGDDVVISLPDSNPTIDLRGGIPANIHNLQSDELLLIREPLTLTGTATLTALITVKDNGRITDGEWNATDVSVQSGTTIEDGTWHLSGALTADNNTNNRLSDVTVDGTIRLNSTKLGLSNASTFTRAELIGANSVLGFSDASTITGHVYIGGGAGGHIDMFQSGTLTIAPGASIEVGAPFNAAGSAAIGTRELSGFQATMSLINNGTIRVDRVGAFGNTITIGPLNFANHGLVQVERQSQITLSNSWDNTDGILRTTDTTSKLSLGGTVHPAALGTIDPFAGSSVTFSGTLDNTGATYTIDQSTNPIFFNGTLLGGTLTFGDGLDTNPGKMFKTLKAVNVQGAITLREPSTTFALQSFVRFTEMRIIAPSTTVQLTAGSIQDHVIVNSTNFVLNGSNVVVTSTAVIDLRAGSTATIGGANNMTFDAQIIADQTGPVTLTLAGGLAGQTGAVVSSSFAIPNGSVTLAGLTYNGTLNVNGVCILSDTFRGMLVNNGTVSVTGALTIRGNVQFSSTSHVIVHGNAETVVSTTSGSGGMQTVAGEFTVDGAYSIHGSSSPDVTMNSPVSVPQFQLDVGTVIFNATPLVPFTLLSSTFGVLDGSADVTLTGSSSVSSFRFNGTTNAARLIIPSGASLDITLPGDNPTEQTRTIENSGLLRYVGTSTSTMTIRMFNGPQVNNLASGTIELLNADIQGGSGGTPSINNAGTIRAGSATMSGGTFDVALNNTGTVQVVSNLTITGGHGSGVFVVPDQKWITFTNSYTFDAGATATGNGLCNVQNGTFNAQALTLGITGQIVVSSATATFGQCVPTTWGISGSTVTFNSATTMLGGSLSGTVQLAGGDLTIGGAFGWTSGTINGPGALRTSSGGAISSPSSSVTLTLNTALENAGTIMMAGGKLHVNAPNTILPQISNLAGGLIQLAGGTIENGTASPMTFNNAGTIRRAAGTTEAILANFVFENSGMIDAQGRLTLSSSPGHTSAGGAMTVGIAGWLDWTGNANWTFDPGSSFSSAGTFRVLGGQHVFAGDTLFPSGIFLINNGSVTLASAGVKAINNLLVQLTGRFTLAAGADKLLKPTTFFVGDAGVVDLNDNDLLLDYSGASPGSYIGSLVAAARSGGAWTGVGITSSAAKNNPQHNTTLGAIEASDYKSVWGANATFDGEAIDNTAVLVKYTYYGDTDFNGKVDGADYARIDNSFNQQAAHDSSIGGWFNGDFDYNGKIDGGDYALIDAAFNSQGAALGPSASLPPPRTGSLSSGIAQAPIASGATAPPLSRSER